MKRLPKQQGAAIIVALFVVALVAAISVVMMQRFRTDVRRTELILNANKAYLLAQGSLAWAIDQLNTNWLRQQPNQVIDRTPYHFPVQEEEGATLSTSLEDAQGLFNVNNVSDAQYQPNFIRLILVVAPNIDGPHAQEITLALVDWISATSKNVSLNEYYLKLPKPYQAPHRPMASVTELRLVKGMSPELYSKLLPYVTALPKTTAINVNNAGIPVLMSLSPTLSMDGAKAIYLAAHTSPFPTIEAFTNFDIVKNNPFEQNKVTIISNYFLVKTNVKVGNQTITLNTLLERAAQGSKTKSLIIWQSKGTE